MQLNVSSPNWSSLIGNLMLLMFSSVGDTFATFFSNLITFFDSCLLMEMVKSGAALFDWKTSRILTVRIFAFLF